MNVRIISLVLLFFVVLNVINDYAAKARPIVITINTCLGRSQLNSDGEMVPLPDGGECHFNTFTAINEWYAQEYANGREVYKKKYWTRKVNEVQQREREEGCIREPFCELTKDDCPDRPDWQNEEHQELCCKRCQRLSITSEKGCVPNPEGCPDPDVPVYIPTVLFGLNGEYKGDCSGRGFFDPKRDIWPSRTGCFNPEERFTVEEPDATAPIVVTPIPMVRVPDDTVLNIHPLCAERAAQAWLPHVFALNERSMKDNLFTDTNQVICLGNDYIDDADNFCSQFMPTRLDPIAPDMTAYETDRMIYRTGLGTDECSTEPGASGWEVVTVDKLVMPVGYVSFHIGANYVAGESGSVYTVEEHYLPLALELPSNHPAVPGYSMIGTPHANMHYDLGEYGFNNARIAKGEAPAAGFAPAAWEFQKNNVYNYDTVPTYDDILQINAMGVKAKKMECLKVYIEEWAHAGDCGQIVIEGARAGASEGHCQWLTMYRADQAAFSFDPTSLAGLVVDPPRRSMRAEFYDYENLNRTGWIRSFPDGTLLESTDICSFNTTGGDGNAFYTPPDGINRGRLDFSKRGCPSVSGPDLFPRFGCDKGDGAKKLEENPLLTTDVEDAVLSAVWEIQVSGFGIPLHLITLGNPDDWIDTTYPARSCITYLTGIEDVYEETADCQDLTCMGEHDGFLYKKGVNIYEWETNVPTLANGNLWCEFEIPFDPYREGSPSVIADIEFPRANDRIDDTSTITQMTLRFPRIERIRSGCGAFEHRGTWHKEVHNELHRFMRDKDKGLCDDWKGFYGKEYDKVSAISWRLPRFDYEFLKAFLQCTGPVTDRFEPCDSVDKLRVAYNALPVQYGGCGCVWQLDDRTEPNEWADEYDEDEPFGFWCNCRSDKFITVECDESYCTCQQNVLVSHGLLTICEGYGPFKRWLRCFYQARAKACPVLTRDVSAGMVTSTHMLEDPCNPSEDDCDNVRIEGANSNPNPGTSVVDAMQIQSSEDDMCDGQEEILRFGNMRWQAQEPNYLARLPVTVDAGGAVEGVGAYKHFDFMYFSQVRDVNPPFMEPMIPWPLEVANHCPGVDPNCSNYGDLVPFDAITGVGVDATLLTTDTNALTRLVAVYQEGLNAVSENFANHDTGSVTSPSPRTQEAIVGPRGCDIGGWYEMMLYQARCIKWFKLNCICEYDKTFVFGSAEAHVLRKAGMQFNTVRPRLRPGADNTYGTSDDTILYVNDFVLWPLLSRGIPGPYYASCAREGSKLWDKSNIGQNGPDGMDICAFKEANPDIFNPSSASYDPNWVDDYDVDWVDDGTNGTAQYRGLSEAAVGDFMILDETIKNRPWVSSDHADYDEAGDPDNYPVDNRFDARYRRHVAYVQKVEIDQDDPNGDAVIEVSEMNYGKNMDSCGNTDRWNYETVRRIHSSEDAPEVWDASSASLKFCSNPDWKDCYEPNWERIKLYRPTYDVYPLPDPADTSGTIPDQHTLLRPVCYARDNDNSWFYGNTNPLEIDPPVHGNIGLTDPYQPFFPKKITGTALDSIRDIGGTLTPVPTIETAKTMTAADVIDTGAWKRFNAGKGLYDYYEVKSFLLTKRGRCDPPLSE